MKKKYGKSYKNIFKHKKSFYNDNIGELKKIQRINSIYIKGPARKKCKICENTISKFDFVSHKVNYVFCKNCGHLNGQSEETKLFFEKLYHIQSAKNPNSVYTKEKYISRVKDIYIPKLNFLLSTTKKISGILDFGSGAGYFINACKYKKINSYGVENDIAMQKLSEKFNKKKNVKVNNYLELINFAKKKNLNCLSAINVIEHLENPNEFLEFFIKSDMKYLFISVPLVSFSILLEHCNQDIFPKQLGGAHTHLFSKKSLNFLFKKYNLKILSEWWFGTDIPDLFRVIYVKNRFYNKKTFSKFLDEYLINQIDDLQQVFNKFEKSQEVHIVLSKNDK